MTKSVKICSFNIQDLAGKKQQDESNIDVLVRIIQQYDVFLIQEVQDEKICCFLLEKLNAASEKRYCSIVSKNIPPHKSKEKYLLLYSEESVQCTDSSYFEDKQRKFKRAPLIVRFSSEKTCIKDFVVVALDLKDSKKSSKFCGDLITVYNDVKERLGSSNILFVGQGAYLNRLESNETAHFYLHSDTITAFKFNVAIEADKRKSPSESSVFGRFVVCGEDFNKAIRSVGIFKFDAQLGIDLKSAISVNDYYPVQLEILGGSLEHSSLMEGFNDRSSVDSEDFTFKMDSGQCSCCIIC